MVPPPRRRSRPSPELMAALHAGKAALREQRVRLELREKIRLLLELQQIVLPLISRQRPLEAWERPWDVTP